VPLAIVEGNPPFRLCLGRRQLAKIEQYGTQRVVAPQAEARVWLDLGDGEELCRHFASRLELGPYDIKQRQPCQDGEERQRVPYLLAQLARLAVGVF
jgi:hypothetical protein